MRQLDLFTDSLPVQRTNALIDALCRLDGAVARQALYSLASIDPECEIPSLPTTLRIRAQLAH